MPLDAGSFWPSRWSHLAEWLCQPDCQPFLTTLGYF